MVKFLALFACAGLGIPLMFTLIWYINDYYPFNRILRTIQIFLWPSSLAMMAAAGKEGVEYYKMLGESISINILLYALIGVLVWLGVSKQQWILYLTAVFILLLWLRLLTL